MVYSQSFDSSYGRFTINPLAARRAPGGLGSSGLYPISPMNGTLSKRLDPSRPCIRSHAEWDDSCLCSRSGLSAFSTNHITNKHLQGTPHRPRNNSRTTVYLVSTCRQTVGFTKFTSGGRCPDELPKYFLVSSSPVIG